MKYLRSFVLIIACLMISGCEEKFSTKVPDDFNISLINNGVIEVYDEIKLNDLIDKINGDVLSDNELIDTTKVGKFIYQLKFSMNDKKYIYDLNYEVVDTSAPLVLSANSKTVSVNYEGDLCNLIWVADNYDKKAECSIEGDYDLSLVDSYLLKYIFTDSSGNETIRNITLNVIEPTNNNTNTEKEVAKVDFSEVLSAYKTDETEIGIDVSKWQGEIDFQKVKDAGATFVMIRIGVQSQSNSELKIDEYFEQNIKNAKEAGLKVGVYLYSIATTKKESIDHAKWVIDKLNKQKLDLPIVFDWESWSYWNNYNLSLYDINTIADSFIKTVKDSGYEGMIYSSKNYLQYIWANKNDYPIWLAHYTDETDYAGDYMLWQITDRGRIDGINSDVDINILYHNK